MVKTSNFKSGTLQDKKDSEQSQMYSKTIKHFIIFFKKIKYQIKAYYKGADGIVIVYDTTN
jgi:hypothetical protein